jgi:hypothetical protein
MMQTTFELFDLDANACWNRTRRFKFADVTRIDFGAGYESALSLFADKVPLTKK